MNENTEVRTQLVVLAGYIPQHTSGGGTLYGKWGTTGIAYRWSLDDLIPNTLDEAAKLPEGWDSWTFERVEKTYVLRVWNERYPKKYVDSVGDTELAARFALRLAVEKIEHERKVNRA